MGYLISWAGVRFLRAQQRAHTSSARQSILLIMEMILHTLIAIVALKAAEINRFEVTKKVDTFVPPPCPEYTVNNTARYCDVSPYFESSRFIASKSRFGTFQWKIISIYR